MTSQYILYTFRVQEHTLKLSKKKKKRKREKHKPLPPFAHASYAIQLRIRGV